MPASKRPPFVRKMDFFIDPFFLYQNLKGRGPSILLESARQTEKTGRYSFVAVKPSLIFESKGRNISLRVPGGASKAIKGDPLRVLRKTLAKYSFQAPHNFPPFTGGAVGYFGYELKNLLEPSLQAKAKDDLGLPDIFLLFFDEGFLVDHVLRETYFFKKGGTEGGFTKIKQGLKDLLREGGSSSLVSRGTDPKSNGTPRLESTVDRAAFVEKVKKAKEHIRKGDIYQANLSQRFSFPLTLTAEQVYSKLRKVNPSPFFGILDAGSFQIVSGSPERLIKLEKGSLETRPIAGTRSRGKTASEDRKIALELMLSQKERAEHVMLLDLERNDMGRVCEYGSVLVDELMVLEDYSHVKHIVSNVRGVLKKGKDAIDVLKAFFPGGTITGAPKVRCMEIIDELETVARGPYTGSLGYLGFDGNMDLNIIIRSLVLKNGKAYLHVGAGIVADSDPDKEYDETLYKAEAIFAALFGNKRTRSLLEGLGASPQVS